MSESREQSYSPFANRRRFPRLHLESDSERKRNHRSGSESVCRSVSVEAAEEEGQRPSTGNKAGVGQAVV